MKNCKFRSSLLVSICTQTYSCWKATCYDASSSHYHCGRKFSLPPPAAQGPIINIAKKCVTLKHQQRSSGGIQSMNCPFLLLLRRIYFKMLSPSMFEVGLPFQRDLLPSILSWFKVHVPCSRHTTEMSKAYHKALFQNILF